MENNIKIFKSFILILVVLSLIIFHHLGSKIAATPPPLCGDYNEDGDLDLKDISLYFNYLADSVEVLGEDNYWIQTLDVNGNGIRDSLDAMWIILCNVYPTETIRDGYGPIFIHPDSFPSLSERAKVKVHDAIDLAQSWSPEFANNLYGIRRQFGLLDIAPVPINPDLDFGYGLNLLDVQQFFINLKMYLDSSGNGSSVFPQMDYNVDGRLDVIDTEAFIALFTYYEGAITGIHLSLEDDDHDFASRLVVSLFRGIGRPESWLSVTLRHIIDNLRLTYTPSTKILGDLNGDLIRNINDAALYFNYLTDSLGVLPDTNAILYQMDCNFDGRVDSLDTEYFFYFFFYNNPEPETPADSLVPMTQEAKYFAFKELERLTPLRPEWSGPIEYIRKVIESLPTATKKNCDINGDGRVNIVDAIALLIAVLKQDPSADWDGDSELTINDVISFITDIRNDRC